MLEFIFNLMGGLGAFAVLGLAFVAANWDEFSQRHLG